VKLKQRKNHFVYTLSGQKFHVLSEPIPEFDMIIVGLVPIPVRN